MREGFSQLIPCKNNLCLAGATGIEPVLTVLETVVLATKLRALDQMPPKVPY